MTSPEATARRRTPHTSSKDRIDAYKMASDAVLAALERGTIPWRMPFAAGPGAIPRNLATGRAYRGINVLLLSLTGHGSPYWLTYKQAKALGGQVRKGERSTLAVLWKRTVKRLTSAAQEEEQRAAGRRVQHDERGAFVVLVLARTFPLFNACQVDGLADVPEVQPIGEPTWTPERRAQEITEGYEGPSIADGGSGAYYNPVSDHVQMPDRGRFQDATDWHAVLFHELAHSTGHRERLNRPDLVAPNSDTKAYAREELTAEMTAAMLCTVAGIDTAPLIERSAAYIDGWRSRIGSDPKLVVLAAQRAQRAADLILGEQPATDEQPTGEHEAVAA
jgi:antirestriction protein ArdC